ncbi:hypothetical protein Tco_1105928 [Tanacetum coccineum]
MEFESANSNTTAIDEDTSSKAMLAIDGVGFDWSDMAEEQCDDSIVKLNQTEFTAATYKRGLATVEEQLITYRKNEVLFSEEVAVLKREVACKDYEINVLKSEFEKVKQEKEGIEFKIEKFDKASKDLDKFLESQITDKSKKGLRYSVVPPPHPLIYNRPKKLNLSYSSLDEFKEPEFKGYGSDDRKKESNVVCDKKSDDSKENSDNSLVKEQVSKDTSSFVESSLNVDKETIFPVDKKVESVKPKNHEKLVKKSVRYAEMYRSQPPRGNQRNWNGQKSTQLGSDFVMYNKACFICGSFNHVQAQCKYHQRERMVYGNNYNRVNYNYTTKRTHPNAQRNMVPRAILMKTGLKPFNTTRIVNIAHPKSIVFSVKPMSCFPKIAHSTIRRPFQSKTTLSNKRFTHKVNAAKAQAVNTARPQAVNTARPKIVKTARPNSAVVNVVRVNQANAVKASACWVWRPTKPNCASITLKKYNYIDARCISKHVKRGRDTKIPQSSSPLVKVGDEVVHNKLGDRMERAATTASSLEAARQWCQDTILGDVDAQTWFETTSKQSNDPPLSRGYTLGGGEDKIEVSASNLKLNAFWATAKVNTVNGERQLQALIDKKNVIITESSIRSDLHLEDAGGTDYLPTTTIFEELARMGYEKPSQKLTFYKAFFSPQWKFLIHTNTQCLSAKSTAWNEFSSAMASLIICLATNQKFNLSKYIFDAMVKHLDGGIKFLIYPRFLQVFINQQLGDMSHHKKIYVNPSHTKKIFANMKREGNNFSGRITPLFATMMVQPNQEEGVDSGIPTDHHQTPITTQPSSSRSQKKQPRRKQRKDTVVTQEETQQDGSVPTPSNDLPLSGEDSMQLSELMLLCTNLQKQVLDLEKAKDAQAKEIGDLKKRVQNLERKKKSRTIGLQRLRKVSMSRRVESSEDKESLGDHEDASKQGRSIEDIDKDADVSLVDDTQGRSDDAEMFDINDLHGDEVNVDMPVEITLAQTLIQIKEAKPKVVTTAAITTTTTRPKARGVVVQEPSEFRTPQESQPSMIKDKGKAIMIEPEVPLKRKDQVALDEDLARNLQAQLEAELIEEERLARKQEEEANIALIDKKEIEESSKGTEDELKSDKSKKTESSEEKAKGRRKKILGKKRAGKEQQQESSKRQRIEDDKETDEHEEVEADDEAELKKHLVIVKDDDIAIDAIPLATKPLVIVEYKLLKDTINGTRIKLIRADGSSKRYSLMIRMPQDISREDLQTLWKLVKTKHGDIRPEYEHERVLWGDLKVMFEPDIKSDVWRNLQGYKVTV